MEEVENLNYWKNRPLDDVRRDWYYNTDNWITDYRASVEHPHRKLIINALQGLVPFESLLEGGCNCGPNLRLIKQKFPTVKLAGVDINENAVREAQNSLPDADIEVGNIEKGFPFEDKSFDIALVDAVLIYVGPEKIGKVMSELDRVARKGIILVEWDSNSPLGEVKEYHWTRDYKRLLEELEFKVRKIKIPPEAWPTRSGNWARLGYIFSAKREST